MCLRIKATPFFSSILYFMYQQRFNRTNVIASLRVRLHLASALTLILQINLGLLSNFRANLKSTDYSVIPDALVLTLAHSVDGP